MSKDVMVRGLSDQTISALELGAACLGESRNAFIVDILEDAARPFIEQRHLLLMAFERVEREKSKRRLEISL